MKNHEPGTARHAPNKEPRWHASLAVVVATLLYLILPPRLTFGPVWAAPLLIGVLLVPLSIFAPLRHQEKRRTRIASIVLIAILNFFNIASVVLLVHGLVYGSAHKIIPGSELLTSGGEVWFTNVLVFALWFWELDGGGPGPRAQAAAATEFRHADFLFPQMSMDATRMACVEQHWKPLFLDYLYLGFTNALAFSPTDVMPLSRMAKMLMLLESLISFVTIAVIVSRSINIIA
ncbi:MAG: hypothetical protein ACYDGM_04370 [Vulcanimicrobiaceae bacterium]